MKKQIVSFILCLGTIAIIAQPAETTDSKAIGILQSLNKKTKAYKTINAEFTITQYGKDKKPGETQKGSIWVKGAKYKLDIKNQTTFCDSNTTWTYLKDANEVQINQVDHSNERGNLSPATIFTFYENGFKSRFVSEDKENNVVDLYPKHPEKEKYHTIRLIINKEKNQVTEIKALMKDGTTVDYAVDKFNPNIVLTNSVFTFDAKNYPGVETEDLRE